MIFHNLQEKAMEVVDVLNFLDENPRRFLTGRCKTEIRGQKCIISRNYVRGGIVVSFAGEVFEFIWDKDSEKWVRRPAGR